MSHTTPGGQGNRDKFVKLHEIAPAPGHLLVLLDFTAFLASLQYEERFPFSIPPASLIDGARRITQ
jgi:hypothetical protein